MAADFMPCPDRRRRRARNRVACSLHEGLGILAFLTLVEYFYAMILKDYFLLLVIGLVILALIKAGMVGWYFMHLKFERNWVYLLIVPACILAIFLTLSAYPRHGHESPVTSRPAAKTNRGLHPRKASGPVRRPAGLAGRLHRGDSRSVPRLTAP